jgi:hypothetical protein
LNIVEEAELHERFRNATDTGMCDSVKCTVDTLNDLMRELASRGYAVALDASEDDEDVGVEVAVYKRIL